MGNFILCSLISLCLGYFLGRHIGWQEGLEEGLAYAPIRLRAQALMEGRCPLCQAACSLEADCEEFDT